jgi:hypothetical protein
MLGPSAVPERADLELAADDANGELVADFPAATWSAIRLAGLDLALLAAAENGGDSAVHSVLAALGVGQQGRLSSTAGMSYQVPWLTFQHFA